MLSIVEVPARLMLRVGSMSTAQLDAMALDILSRFEAAPVERRAALERCVEICMDEAARRKGNRSVMARESSFLGSVEFTDVEIDLAEDLKNQADALIGRLLRGEIRGFAFRSRGGDGEIDFETHDGPSMRVFAGPHGIMLRFTAERGGSGAYVNPHEPPESQERVVRVIRESFFSAIDASLRMRKRMQPGSNAFPSFVSVP
jgi:hypothetical protein